MVECGGGLGGRCSGTWWGVEEDWVVGVVGGGGVWRRKGEWGVCPTQCLYTRELSNKTNAYQQLFQTYQIQEYVLFLDHAFRDILLTMSDKVVFTMTIYGSTFPGIHVSP